MTFKLGILNLNFVFCRSFLSEEGAVPNEKLCINKCRVVKKNEVFWCDWRGASF